MAVQASRISTYLHRRGRPGKLPTGVPGGSFNPFAFFCGKCEFVGLKRSKLIHSARVL